MLTGLQILNKLQENADLFKKLGVSKIGLFGSYGQEQQTEASDIDILVDFEPSQKTFDNYMELKIFLEDTFNKKVDLVLEEKLKPGLKNAILGSVKYAKGA